MKIKADLGAFSFMCCLSLVQSHFYDQGDHKENLRNSGVEEESDIRNKRATGNVVYENPWLDADWNKMGKDRIAKNIKTVEEMKNTNKAKNVIIFIGDGMGLPTVAAARVYKSQKFNLKKEDIYLSWEKLPHASLSRTYNVDRITSDSAATGTAYMCGVKANLGTIGVNEKVKNKKCENMEGNKLKSILHKSIEEGKSTGFVTTTRVTHASPAATYASTPSRYWEFAVPEGADDCVDIASQLISDDRNQDIRVIFGGGSRNLLPEDVEADSFGAMGNRTDGKNLIKEWEERKEAKGATHKVLRNKTDLDNLDTAKTDFVLGLFGSSNLNYEVDREPEAEPNLAEMTVKAIEILSKNKNGYFLFVEGGRIDHAHHNTMAKKALEDTLAFDDAITKTLALVDIDETLVIVSADHSHTFTVSGYAPFESSILGFSDEALSSIQDGKPSLQINYANGPGAKYHRFTEQNSKFVETPRLDLSKNPDEIYDMEFQQDASVWSNSEHHGAEDVGIYAAGPWSHLFQATEEQSYIAQVMMHASCVGQYRAEKHCVSGTFSSHHPSYFVCILSIVLAAFTGSY